MGKLVVRLCTLTLGLLALTACGGGGGNGGGAAPMVPPGPNPGMPASPPMAPPGPNPGMPASPPATQDPPVSPPSPLPLQTEQDTDRMRTFLLGGTLHIGGEIDTSHFHTGAMEAINSVTRSFLAAVSTGESPDTLAAYLHEDSREATRRLAIDHHETVPVVFRNGGGQFSPEEMDLVIQALQIINESLPADFQLRYEHGLPTGTTTPISVFFAPREEWQNLFGETIDPAHISDTTLGQTRRFTFRGDVLRALVQVDLERSGENRLQVLVHELMHAMGRHHVPQHFNTIMIPTLSPSNPGHLIYPLDTDALQAVYNNRLVLFGWRYMDADAILRELGDWTQATDQLLGRVFPVGGGMAEFGAQLRNGHVRAFARGPEPQTDFVYNPANLGATWRGALSGFTYTGRPLQGTTRLDIDADLQGGNAVGDLLFRRLESFAPGGLADTSTPYAGGSLDYQIEVRGNTFRETSRSSDTEGRVDGAFFTRDHRAMGGVLQRSDARAGFGGERR